MLQNSWRCILLYFKGEKKYKKVVEGREKLDHNCTIKKQQITTKKNLFLDY